MTTHRGALVIPPAWMWGGKPEKFFEAAGLRLRRAGQDGYIVRTREDYRGLSRPLLVDDSVVLTAGGRRGAGYSQLSSFVDDEVESSVLAKLERTRVHAPEPGGHPILDIVNQAQLNLTMCSGSELPAVCEAVLGALQDVTLTGGSERALPHSSVLAIRREPALVHRVMLDSVLMRVERDPQLAAGDAAHLKAEQASGRTTFGSSESLRDGIYIFDAYVAPLLGALSPAVWAFPVHRVHGTIITSYGRPVSGTAEFAPDLLRTLRSVGGGRDLNEPAYGPFAEPRAAEFATSWWATQLDAMFGVLTDPAVFARDGGHFDPTSAMQALLTVEQLFRRVYSIQLAHNDTYARRTVFFSAIDTIRTLSGGVPNNKLFDHAYALKTLRRLEERIPVGAQEILLPSAQRGVAALRAVQDGFFLRDASNTVRLGPDGPPVALNVAAAEYLGALRDATHGFSTTKVAKQKVKLASLLATHDGRLGHTLGFLAWLYLLDFLADPVRLRKILSDPTRW